MSKPKRIVSERDDHHVMHVQPKTRWMLAGALVILLGAGSSLWMLSAPPRQAIKTAEEFVDRLKSHELKEAYRLTTQKDAVGKSYEAFQSVVAQQWAGAPAAPVQRVAVRPFQSYGNRLRRWVRGREVEMPEVSVEFSIGGIPFEVRERHVGEGEWKVYYFQSHAG